MNILLLAGSGEARQLASELVARGHQLTASMAGVTRMPKPLGCETRVGGFGGDVGFAAWLDSHQPDLVLDATHPFAHRISRRTYRICQTKQIRYLQLLRDPWMAHTGDHWIEIANARDARSHIESGARVFLATGRQTLSQFSNLHDCYLLCRQIDPPTGPFPFPNGDFLIGRPPFSIDDEVALFKRLTIDYLVVKNAGGDASRSKLDAARALGLPVIMLKRPAAPNGVTRSSVAAILKWIEIHADH